MVNKTKNLGQIYTPIRIINDMLDIIDYQGEKILQKHIIDNSCGDGAFLRIIIERYIKEYKKKHNGIVGIEKELEKYIHGIEIDKNEYFKCLNNLSQEAFWLGLSDVNWDVINADTLEVHIFDSKMDYVVGNPPYIRIHNLMDNFLKIRNYSFCKSGMSDMFIVFYEIGFNMLNEKGKLCYITPNSFYSSVAGFDFRHYIINTKHLYSVVDLGHYQPFNATTYTTICAFDFSKTFDSFEFKKYTKDGSINFEEQLDLKEAFNNGKMILAKKREQEFLIDIQNYKPKKPNDVFVKNGFATLCDTILISNNLPTDENVIEVIKASTGEWKKAVFPYDKNGHIINFDKLSINTQNYLLKNKDKLVKRSIDANSPWYAFGRSQAINDVFKTKFSINTTIRDKKSIKIHKVDSGKGVYSGLYIITSMTEQRLKEIIISDDFINYISIIGKCKNGGYFTFSSNDLRQYILYKKENTNDQ